MIAGVIKRVFVRPFYILLSTFVAALTLSVLLLLPNKAVLTDVLFSSVISLSAKLSFLFSLYGSLMTNFTLFAAVYTVLIAILLGVNVSLLWYYATRARKLSKADRSLTFTGIGGFVSGLFGIGCAACGTILFVGLLNLLGIAWLVTYLPLHGAEFGLIGVVLLLVTSYSLVKRISDPLICPID